MGSGRPGHWREWAPGWGGVLRPREVVARKGRVGGLVPTGLAWARGDPEVWHCGGQGGQKPRAGWAVRTGRLCREMEEWGTLMPGLGETWGSGLWSA